MSKMVTITLTHKEWNELSCYILRNTMARQNEIDAWESLSKEMEDDGVTPKFPNAPGMKKFEEETKEHIEAIQQKIDEACITPQIGQSRLEELVTLMKDGLLEDDEEQAYIYFKETCDMDVFEANFFGLDFDKWEEYNGESIFKKD